MRLEYFLFAMKYIGKNIIAELWNENAARIIAQYFKNFLSMIYLIESPITAAANICRRYVKEKKKTNAKKQDRCQRVILGILSETMQDNGIHTDGIEENKNISVACYMGYCPIESYIAKLCTICLVNSR